MHSSFLSRNILYAFGASSSGSRWVITNDRVDLAALDALEQRLQVALHVGLAHLERQPLVRTRRRTASCRGSRRRRRGSRPCRPCGTRGSPGAARRPVGRQHRRRLRAGRSSASSVAPCASMPTASMHASGPRPPVISFSALEDVVLVEVDRLGARRARAPSAAAPARGRSRSPARRRAGSALAIANCPTGPQPQTATVSPGWMSQFSAAM